MNVVGQYQEIEFSICGFCHKQTVSDSTYALLDSEISEYQPLEVCSHCKQTPSSEFRRQRLAGRRFTCPKCNHFNELVIEPTNIYNKDGDKFISYNNNELMCENCFAEFGACVIAKRVNGVLELDNDPALWNRILYNKEHTGV